MAAGERNGIVSLGYFPKIKVVRGGGNSLWSGCLIRGEVSHSRNGPAEVDRQQVIAEFTKSSENDNKSSLNLFRINH